MSDRRIGKAGVRVTSYSRVRPVAERARDIPRRCPAAVALWCARSIRCCASAIVGCAVVLDAEDIGARIWITKCIHPSATGAALDRS